MMPTVCAKSAFVACGTASKEAHLHRVVYTRINFLGFRILLATDGSEEIEFEM